MAHWITTAAFAPLLLLTVPAFGQDDVNYLEISLLKYLADVGDRYGISFDANKDGYTSCTLETPGDPSGSECSFDVIRWDLTYSQLTAEIGSGSGADWTLTWDEGLPTETLATIDFGSVPESDWLALPTISNPPDGASGVSPQTSIDWTWPAQPDLDRVEVLMFGPNGQERDSDEFPPPPPEPTSWTPLSPLASGPWQAVVLNGNDIRDVPIGISISGDPWVLENSDWLSASSIDFSSFTVAPPVPALPGWPAYAVLAGLLILVGVRSAYRPKKLRSR
jgi:hypothetical protein